MGLTEKGKKTVGMLKKIGIVLVLAGATYFVATKFIGKKGDKKSSVAGGSSTSSVEADLTLAYNTFPGMEGILLMNGGMEPNPDGKLYKKYGIKLRIKQMDIVADTRAGLKSGDLDLVYCTTDALPVEMGSSSELVSLNVKEIMKVNESRGADVIVVTKGINTVADLKGKKIAYAVATASHTLLINVLETAGLTAKDITEYKVNDGVEASSAFKAGQCDAALVWAPDDEDCVDAVKGSKILASTKTATQIIADGLLVTKANLDEKRELIVKLCKAWLEGNGEMNTNSSAKKDANKLFADGFKFPEDIAAKSADKIRFSTLGDNKNFFGFDATFTGVTGEKMYTRMSVKYAELGLAKGPVAWRIASDASVIEELLADKEFLGDNKQNADKAVVFTPPTEVEKKQVANSNKVVTLTFPTNSYQLDESAKNIIDREISQLAQGFAGARVRVEGNTDNVGAAKANKELSLKRAQAVVNYLIQEHHFDPNKFIVQGNGSDKPVSGCESNADEDCKQRNRRTDFQFIWQ
jgi:NitT/TauT family transport system substrate-binding protein